MARKRTARTGDTSAQDSLAGGAAPEEAEAQREAGVVAASRADPQPSREAPAAIVVTGPKRGRWRAGRFFGPQPVALDPATLDPADLAAIEADPVLDVTYPDAAG